MSDSKSKERKKKQARKKKGYFKSIERQQNNTNLSYSIRKKNRTQGSKLHSGYKIVYLITLTGLIRKLVKGNI